MSASKNPSPTRLELAADWPDWNATFQGRARRAFLWEYIDPDNNDPPTFMNPPELPDIHIPSTSGVQTRSGSATTDTRSISEDDKFLLRFYEIRLRKFEKQAAAISELSNWVESTVGQNIRRQACLPNEDLRQWYKNLKKTMLVDTKMLLSGAREKYRKFMHPLSKAPKDIIKWTSDLEEMIIRSARDGLDDAKRPSTWFTDLTRCTKSFLGLRLDLWALKFESQIDDETLDIRDITNRIRLEAEKDSFDSKGSKVVRGGFGPAAPVPDGSTPTGPTLNGTDDPKDHQAIARNKRKRMSTAGKTCKACGQFHQLAKCFYVFQHKLPSWFKEDPAVRKTVDQNLATDTSLVEEIARLRKPKDDQSPASASSE